MTTFSASPVVEEQEPTVPPLSQVAARAAASKSGEETTILAMADLLGLTDAFVITAGRNTRQVFLDEARSYYDLEHLWAEAPRIPWESPDPS